MWFFILALASIWALKWLYCKILFPPKLLELSKLGRWAVITGATDGIGKAFAEELASKGMDIVLISRTMSKLEDTAKEIRDKYGVSTKVIKADLTSAEKKMYDRIEKLIADLDVGVLINNVGTFYDHPEYFHKLECHQETIFKSMINCNMISTVRMIEFLLPSMVSKKKGLIINVSSGLSEIPMPFASLYAGTKAFVSKMSKDLYIECKDQGVKIHLLKTGMVATKMLRIRNASWLIPSPQQYVQNALKETLLPNLSESTGYPSHTFTRNTFTFLRYLFPDYIDRKIHELGLEKKEVLNKKCKYCHPPEEQ